MAEVTQQIVDDIRSSLADVGFGEVAIGHSAGPLRLPPWLPTPPPLAGLWKRRRRS